MNLELLRGSRSRVFAGIMLTVMALFVARLFYLQIIQHDYYVSQADNEQIKRLAIPAKRGLIYALDGTTPVSLVMNQTVYTVFADPLVVDNDSKVIETIKKVAGGNARGGLEGLLAKKSTRYQILATGLSRAQADMIKQEKLGGIGFQEVSKRVYPEGGLAAQVLGFVDFEGKGKYGIESAMNDELTGKDGLLQSVTDVSDVPLTIGNRNISVPKEDGDNVVLSIDRNIQSYAEEALSSGAQALGAKNASVLVMDPNDGRVLAMSNIPTYSPGEYNKVEDAAAFNNGVISYPYEPASVIKTFALSLGVDTGTIRPSDTYTNTDYVTIEDRTITNASKGQTGETSFQKVFNWSLNTGSVEVFKRLGNGTITQQARDVIYEYYHDRFHLGELTGINLANEDPGVVVSSKKTEGNAVRYANMSFGQGLDVTMLQVAAGFSAVINGGKYYSPYIVSGTIEDGSYKQKTPSVALNQPITPQTSMIMRQMLREARLAFYSRNDKPGYYIGGKTGTAETIDASGKYTQKQTQGTYIGFGGNNDPKYVIMVRLWGEGQIFGGQSPIPIFTNISNWLIDYLKLQPKG